MVIRFLLKAAVRRFRGSVMAWFHPPGRINANPTPLGESRRPRPAGPPMLQRGPAQARGFLALQRLATAPQWVASCLWAAMSNRHSEPFRPGDRTWYKAGKSDVMTAGELR
jgi:hypothetical protein